MKALIYALCGQNDGTTTGVDSQLPGGLVTTARTVYAI